MTLIKWQFVNDEWTWQQKAKDQIALAIDLCLLRSLTSKSTWARKYWHSVAEDLREKYVN